MRRNAPDCNNGRALATSYCRPARARVGHRHFEQLSGSDLNKYECSLS
jgi:hypothetical protein